MEKIRKRIKERMKSLMACGLSLPSLVVKSDDFTVEEVKRMLRETINGVLKYLDSENVRIVELEKSGKFINRRLIDEKEKRR